MTSTILVQLLCLLVMANYTTSEFIKGCGEDPKICKKPCSQGGQCEEVGGWEKTIKNLKNGDTECTCSRTYTIKELKQVEPLRCAELEQLCFLNPSKSEHCLKIIETCDRVSFCKKQKVKNVPILKRMCEAVEQKISWSCVTDGKACLEDIDSESEIPSVSCIWAVNFCPLKVEVLKTVINPICIRAKAKTTSLRGRSSVGSWFEVVSCCKSRGLFDLFDGLGGELALLPGLAGVDDLLGGDLTDKFSGLTSAAGGLPVLSALDSLS